MARLEIKVKPEDLDGLIQIKNKHQYKENSFKDFYIGRGSILENFWSSKKSSKLYVVSGFTREQAMAAYDDLIYIILHNHDLKTNVGDILELKQMEEPTFSIFRYKDRFRAELNKMAELVLKGTQINLVCFCAPKPCHGDVIKKYLIEKLKIYINAK